MTARSDPRWRLALPMYNLTTDLGRAWERLLGAVVDGLRQRGWRDAMDIVVAPPDLIGFWRSSDLLLSQSCGYPLATVLGDAVRVIAAAEFDWPGCSGVQYCSAIVVAEGAADSLEALVFWRVLQGALGAPVIPLSQTILLDSFPKRQLGLVTSIFGMAVVIGPVIGPTLGGLLSELYGWRWAFYMLVPVGFLSFAGLRFTLPQDKPAGRTALDWTGFLSLSVTIGCVQLVLSRGQRLDWYESGEIVLETFIAVLAFWVFLAHSLTARQPFLNLRLLLDRNYALGLVLVLIYGMLNFTPMVLLPPLLQQHAGFPDLLIGEIVAARGVGATLGFFLAIFVGRMDPRIGLIGGFALQVFSGLWLMSFDLNVGAAALMANSFVQGIAIGVIWVPLTLVTFSTVGAVNLAEGTAVYHLLRNIGSSFFISICVAEIVRATGVNYGRMVELVNPYNKALALPWVTGGWDFETVQGLARLSKEINRQAAMLGYINAFGFYTLCSALAIPLILLVGRRVRAA